MSDVTEPLDSALVALIKGAIREAHIEAPSLHIDDPNNWESIKGLCGAYSGKIPATTIRRYLNLRNENGLQETGATTRRGKRILTNRVKFAQW